MSQDIFVNRKKEMDELLKIYAKVKEGYGGTVFIIGEPGIGKTYFCEKFCSMAENATILRGFASEDITQPYQPFVQALGEYFEKAKGVGEIEFERITEIIKKRHPQIVGSEEILLNFLSATYTITKNGHEDMQSSRLRMFEIVSRLVHSIASEQPLILFVEDLHWADKSTWNLIHYLARNIENKKVLLLGTYRNDETIDPKSGELRAVVDATQRMRRERLFNEIILTRFTETDTHEFVEQYTQKKLNEENIKKVHQFSEGVPLLLKEFSEYLLHSENFVEIVPESYAASILNRLQKFGKVEQEIIKICAVLGERIDIEILRNLLNIDEEELLEHMEKFCKANILTEISSTEYKFAHNLMRKAIYVSIKDAGDLHLKVANTLEGIPKYRNNTPQMVAYHYWYGKDTAKAAFYYINAGELAMKNYALDEAKKYLETAIETLETGLDSVEKKIKMASALLHLGNIELDRGKLDTAKRAFDRVLRLAFELNSKKMGSEAYRKIGKIFEMKGNFENAFAHYKKALETAIEVRDLLNIAYAYESLGLYCWRVDKLEDGERFFNACLETATQLGDKLMSARCYTGLGNIDIKRGKYEEAIEHFEKAFSTLPDQEVPERLRNMNNMAVALTLIGKYEEAKAKYRELISEGEKYGLIRHIAYAYVNLAAIHREQGALDEALDAGKKSEEYARKINDVYCLTMAKSLIANTLGKKGDLEKFKEITNEVIAVFSELGLHYDMAAAYFDAADTMFYLNRFEEGNEYLRKSIEIGQRIGAHGLMKKLEEIRQKYGDKIKV
ncbi:MAG: tetratricopeptide repeat protein [Thermoplasmata archaeon]